MPVEMKVVGLTIDPSSNAPIVILREQQGTRILPIWIGVVEASAIAFELEQVKLARPMTHDLLRNVIESLGGRVERVLVGDLQDNTFFATIRLSRDNQTIEIDSRPSDAIALALRTQTPIWCDAAVLEQAHLKQEEWEARQKAAQELAQKRPPKKKPEPGSHGPRPITEVGSRPLEEILENLSPEDFGKYKM